MCTAVETHIRKSFNTVHEQSSSFCIIFVLNAMYDIQLKDIAFFFMYWMQKSSLFHFFSFFILLLTFSQTYNNCQIKILWLSCCSHTKNRKVFYCVYALISGSAILYRKHLAIKCNTRFIRNLVYFPCVYVLSLLLLVIFFRSFLVC